ncbi:Plasmodium exported protein, unknown function [Plasmodium relictum]|uniref:Fam-h protein n=1 Tax=Plasmodium relictum TaxID=85471 RepID=A0A1J1GKA3_PLARL|nr:Plasmodium exported protein, unknown function [Plasmodium relictum]CRG84776.1 Plasmodium exported protein, unknown function [Plasmodium relictum]
MKMKNNTIFNITKCPERNVHIGKDYITSDVSSLEMYYKKQKINILLFFNFFLFTLLIFILHGFNSYTYRSANEKQNLGGTINLIYKRILSECNNINSTKSESKLNLLDADELENTTNNDLQHNLNYNNLESQIKAKNLEVMINMLKKNEKEDKIDKKSSNIKKICDFIYMPLLVFPLLLFLVLFSLKNIGYLCDVSDSKLQNGCLLYLGILILLNTIELKKK